MRKVDEILLKERDDAKQEVVIPAETHTLIGSIVPFKGHIMFEINCTTGEITPAIYEEINATLKGGVKRKIITKENCLYISCLNKNSAEKKFQKWFFERTLANVAENFPNTHT